LSIVREFDQAGANARAGFIFIPSQNEIVAAVISSTDGL
jgi:hypothetical protein